jgi:hypothetical protein
MQVIVNGARQVGKTHILKEFGKQYLKQFVHVNLETNLLANSYFETGITPLRILQFRETVTNTRIIAGEAFVNLDEIQAWSRAFASLKTFSEDVPQCHIVAAGSQLSVAINRDQFSFPAGEVDEHFKFAKKYNSPYSIRVSGKNFGYENQFRPIPLYPLFCLKKDRH